MASGRGADARGEVTPHVLEDAAVIEGEGRELVPAEGAGLACVVASHGFALGAPDEDDGDGVHAWIPAGVAVGEELLLEAHFETGLLPRLADGGLGR